MYFRFIPSLIVLVLLTHCPVITVAESVQEDTSLNPVLMGDYPDNTGIKKNAEQLIIKKQNNIPSHSNHLLNSFIDRQWMFHENIDTNRLQTKDKALEVDNEKKSKRENFRIFITPENQICRINTETKLKTDFVSEIIFYHKPQIITAPELNTTQFVRHEQSKKLFKKRGTINYISITR